jgi:hypothetical protein
MTATRETSRGSGVGIRIRCGCEGSDRIPRLCHDRVDSQRLELSLQTLFCCFEVGQERLINHPRLQQCHHVTISGQGDAHVTKRSGCTSIRSSRQSDPTASASYLRLGITMRAASNGGRWSLLQRKHTVCIDTFVLLDNREQIRPRQLQSIVC